MGCVNGENYPFANPFNPEFCPAMVDGSSSGQFGRMNSSIKPFENAPLNNQGLI